MQKQPGCTWIELNKEVHSFTVDDQEHPQIIEICEELKKLSGQMKDLGYVPDTKFVLHDVEDETGCCVWVITVRNWQLHLA